MDETPPLEEAEPGDLEAIVALLEANDLPAADVPEKQSCFQVVRDAGRVVAVGGLEEHGACGLLRSVVVEEPRRGEGLGSGICQALEDRARRRGLEALFLLTTTAEGLFRGRGYVEVPREAVPEGVRETAEFTDLCPESATCMRKDLNP